MALVIEDGTQVTGAQSYATAAQLRAYALLRGVALSVSDSVLEPFLIKAMDYLESKRNQYQGIRVASTQALQFPRAGVTIDGWTVEDDEIPQILLDAQCALAMEVADGNDLMPTKLADSSGAVVREKLEGLGEVQYSDNASGRLFRPMFDKAEQLLAPLYAPSGSAFGFSLVRA